jgi:hypothetical protein
MRDAMNVSNTIGRMNQGSYSLDQSRSAMYMERTKDFLLNTEFETTITFVQ